MTVSLQKVLKSLPKDRQKKIKQKADQNIREYKTLQGLRKDLGLTQSEIAATQGVKQVNISNLEKRSDMHLSTLKKYVEAMGCQLEINIRMPNNHVVRIENPAL